MTSSFVSELHRLVNEHRACMNKAEAIHAQFLGSPTKSLLREEIKCYRSAVEICSRLASLYNYSDTQCGEWMERQAQHERKLRELLHIYEHGLPQKTEVDDTLPTQKGSGEKAAGANTNTNTTSGKGGSGKPTGSEVSQDLVDSWFKPRPGHSFDAVAGMEELKEKLRACVKDVAASRVNEYLGMEVVHSFFLYGPPGCGKTFVTQAFIHELMGDDYSYMFLSGGDVHQALVGMSEKVVERAFKEAQEHAPCILFIDEIDSVCRNRSQPHLPAHAMNTTTAFLNGYNSLMEAKKPVIFIGATNYPDMVDSAMLDRVELIKVPLPDLEVRTFTFEKAFKKILDNEPGFTYADMAEETDNFSQRDCKRLISMVKRAIKDDLTAIYKEDGDAMVAAMEEKKYLLKRQTFMDTLKDYHPSRKEEILRNLDKWDADFQKSSDE